MSDPLARVLATLPTAKQNGSGWMARCPVHDDARASLSISTGDDGRVLLHCHANCATSAIVVALGLTMRDLFPDGTADRKNGGVHISSQVLHEVMYDYVDETGALLFQVVRRRGRRGKYFRQRRPDGQGGWIWKLDGVRRVVYRLPDLAGHDEVLIVEGEKDVETLRRHGFTATTNACGAGGWRAEYAAQLKSAGCRLVVVLPDNDAAGDTHGRQIARSCTDAGLAVKLVPLPDLPHKGDVTDYLGRHTADDLRAILAAAPLFDPARRVAERAPLTFATVADFLTESEQAHVWIVEERIPAGAVVLFCGAPKAGKSTAIRELAAAVASGEPWLGWRTTPGAVWLFAFEDQRDEVRRHIRQLGVPGAAPLYLWIGRPPSDLLAQLHVRARDERPSLILIDTLIHLLRADINDYSQVAVALEPWLEIARSSGATLVLVHHASVHDSREGLHAILGSTALAGSVDNVLILRRVEGRRVLSSVLRTGPVLEPTIIAVHEETGRLYCAGTKRVVDGQDLRERILDVLREAGEPVRESWLHETVEGRRVAKQQALRILLSQHKVSRTGRGERGDPYLYRAADAGTGASGTTNGNGTGAVPESPRQSAPNPRLFDVSPDSGTRAPLYSQVPTTIDPVRTYVEGSSTHDPSASSDDQTLVPESVAVVQPASLPRDVTPDKHRANVGTHSVATDDEDTDERF